MSDLQEMAKELKRAIELDDRAAVEMIADEMFHEARLLQLDDIGQRFMEAVQSGDNSSALVYSAALGRKAGEIDLARGQVFGQAFLAGEGYIEAAYPHFQN